MKSKNISSTVLLLLISILGISLAKAQTHVKAAANCTLHAGYLKETRKTKNAVSCVDCYCKVCGDKKAREKEAARKAAETAAKQKTSSPQTKTTATTATKSKSNEMIMVGPKPKVEVPISTSIKLSPQDQEILELGKVNDVQIWGMRDYNGDNNLFSVDMERVKGKEPLGCIYYKKDGKTIILKNLKLKDATAVGFNYSSKLDENGNFCLNFRWNSPGNAPNSSQNNGLSWSDIVTLEGENLLNDKTIVYVAYKGNGIYEIQKRDEKTPTLHYNVKSKKMTTIQ